MSLQGRQKLILNSPPNNVWTPLIAVNDNPRGVVIRTVLYKRTNTSNLVLQLSIRVAGTGEILTFGSNIAGERNLPLMVRAGVALEYEAYNQNDGFTDLVITWDKL